MSIKRRQAYIALTIMAVIWGSAFPVIKPAFAFITPLQYLYFRFLLAGLISLPLFIYYYYKLHPKISYFIKVLLIESIQIIALPLLYLGLSKTSALQASLIGSTSPIFVVLGGIWFLHERETKREWQGLALSLAGSLLLVAEPILTGKSIDTPSSTWGNMLILGYNLFYTIYAIVAKKFYRTHPPLYFGSLIYFVSAVVYALLLTTIGVETPLTLLTTPHVFPAVFYMAIPGSIIAFALYLYGQSKIEVSEANLFTYLNGVIAIPAAFLLLGEKPSLLTLLATSIIALGVYRAQQIR